MKPSGRSKNFRTRGTAVLHRLFLFAMMMAAELGVDSTPMEGFDNEALDDLLNLRELKLRSVTMLPLGYRDAENDWLVDLKKVRHPKKEFLIEIK